MTDKEKWAKEYKYNKTFAWVWSILLVASVGLAAAGDKPSWFMLFVVMLDLIYNYADRAKFFKSMSE
jgi:hypothetical protein